MRDEAHAFSTIREDSCSIGFCRQTFTPLALSIRHIYCIAISHTQILRVHVPTKRRGRQLPRWAHCRASQVATSLQLGASIYHGICALTDNY